MRENYRFYLQHEETGRITSVDFDWVAIFSGMAIEKISREYGRWYVIAKSQSTGLKDKNGKEIYEGDVVRCFNSDESKYRAVVEWEHAGFIFHWNSSNNYNEGVLHKTPPMLHTHIDTEVIGNVYENSDLLK